ncbi:MAG: response regulator [Lachnospiraceae bacterium]|nr:response regulator [Lachnospiraceae bacterium]
MLAEVLIVDDDIQDLEIMRSYLEGPFRVSEAVSGKLAIEYVRQHPVDVILLDVDMPMMDGFETFEELKKMEECINVPIILVTGRRDKETILNSGIMGVDGFLAKPVSKQTLVGKVNEIYQKKKSKENRKTVLMIDDDMNYLKQVNTMLQDNYNVVIINSAKLALSYLTKHIPDVILMDYQMPLYNGASLMNIIQKNTRGIKVPVIVLSGALNREILQECYQYNPAAILAKPASRKDLIKNIEDALKQ